MMPKRTDSPSFLRKYVENEDNSIEYYYKGLRMFCAPGTHEAVIKAVSKYLKRGSHVIDLGAGTGAFTQRLKDQGYQVSASGINPVTFDLEDTPYFWWDFCEDVPEQHLAGYDAVVAIEVIEHLENIFDFFRKVRCLLKPGGLAFITTPNIFDAKSRLMFLTSGNFLFFQKNFIDKLGHIQIIPFWLLKHAGESANLTYIEMYGIVDIMKIILKDWKREIVRIFIWLKKLFFKERFSGEFSKVSVLIIMKK